MTKEMTRTNPDEIRLNSLRLLAKMIASAHLKQAYPASGSDLVTGESKVGYSKVALTGQDKVGDKEEVDAGTGYS
jgi:hypothetical protein